MDRIEDQESGKHLVHSEVDSSSHTESRSSLSDSSLVSSITERDVQTDGLPPIHMIGAGRPLGYDPNRIPASVFASKPSTPMEWSVASTESLFSIHVGNSSFNREQYNIMMNRSGEFPRLDEPYHPPIGLPTVTEAGNSDIKTDHSFKTLAEGTKEALREPVAEDNNKDSMPPADNAPNYASSPEPAIVNSKDQVRPVDDFPKHVSSLVVARVPAADNSKERMPAADDAPNSVSSPVVASMSTSPSEDYRNSDGSTMSVQSFAFPTFTGDGGRSSSAKVGSAKQRSVRKSQTQSQPEPEPETKPESAKQSQPRVFKGFPRSGKNSWFSCFSCCQFCN